MLFVNRPVFSLLYLLLLCTPAGLLHAQASRTLIGTGGGQVTTTEYSVGFSIGEAVSGLRVGAEGKLLQGFQQPDDAGVILPVTWLNFTAWAEGKVNQLHWRVRMSGRETDFRVERSGDGINFQEVQIQNVAGTPTGTTEFRWEDEDYPPTLLYYRIRQTDFDGAVSISPLQIIDRRGAGERDRLVFYPNPAAGQVWWSVWGDDDPGPLELRLFDAVGRVVRTVRLSDPARPLSLAGLPPGSYNFHCTSGRAQMHGVLIVR